MTEKPSAPIFTPPKPFQSDENVDFFKKLADGARNAFTKEQLDQATANKEESTRIAELNAERIKYLESILAIQNTISELNEQITEIKQGIVYLDGMYKDLSRLPSDIRGIQSNMTSLSEAIRSVALQPLPEDETPTDEPM